MAKVSLFIVLIYTSVIIAFFSIALIQNINYRQNLEEKQILFSPIKDDFMLLDFQKCLIDKGFIGSANSPNSVGLFNRKEKYEKFFSIQFWQPLLEINHKSLNEFFCMMENEKTIINFFEESGIILEKKTISECVVTICERYP